MFTGYTIDCKKNIKEGQNELLLYFHSPIKLGQEIKSKTAIDLPSNLKKNQVKERRERYREGEGCHQT